MKLALSVLVAAAAASVAVAGGLPKFPLYKQCDPRWGGNQMGTRGPGERSTICGEGCAMTSVSMALAGLGVDLADRAVRPDSLNSWLEDNHGYVCIAGDCNNLVLSAPNRVPSSRLQFVSEHDKPELDDMRAAVEKGDTIFVAHVHDSGHFVLVTGVDSDSRDRFEVNDPFYNSTWYPYANISDVIEYRITAGDAPARTAFPLTPASLRGAAPTPSLPSWTKEQDGGEFVVPYVMPLFKQCDSRWGSDKIDTDTICQVGCLMSSTTMALAGHHINVDGKSPNPGILNSWLRDNHGYIGNDLVESAVANVDPSRVSWPADAMHTKNDVPLHKIQEMLRAGRPVIANVMQGHHFVLVVGWNATNPDALAINDPGFNRETYSYTRDVVGWRLFDMKFA
ncbi:hypothetical protein FNF29_01191 [Cafeteria roenbergensis]|uniref:Peptidase C39-like domain-containing protein n=1 Tax=Cafeteria roenbergensis TaxID=33653 RepID=A0A5A8E551_CAFRO|nr:hypothetical protein FNF29_01191 [Cafeteria roenbergensis]KAA0168507.1 hypothetical protein FNF31_00387 [Cafeteria roenbergensis]KAA0171210.1 hypothetical protein FNF28_00976 [Cafeteria roenbergensis]|eukprot:KAA0156399.1 hypothetical protein FNF29_01191 [Cafeteria roenbergensis]